MSIKRAMDKPRVRHYERDLAMKKTKEVKPAKQPEPESECSGKQFVFFRTQDDVNKVNEAFNETDHLLGGWKYERMQKKCSKAGSRLESIISNDIVIKCAWLHEITPSIEIAKLSPKVKSNFIPGYTTRGFPCGTIQINSRWLDTNPPEYLVLSYFLREAIRYMFWKEAISMGKTKFAKTGKKLQTLFSKYGLTVDTKGNLIEGGANQEGRFIFREILADIGIECPEHIQVEIPAITTVPAKRKARKPDVEAIEKSYQEKIESLQMELAYLSDENEQLKAQQSNAVLPAEELDEPSTNYDIPIIQSAEPLEETKQEHKAVGRNKATAGM